MREPSCPVGLPVTAANELTVPTVTGELVEYANLDHAASTPCLHEVKDAVDQILPWYTSIHRGTGFASQVCTRLYEHAREVVRGFLAAPADASVVFTRNTTDALNLLARCLPQGTTVVRFDSDHHAAMLPWQHSAVRALPIPETPGRAVADLDAALRDCGDGPKLVVLTGASNVTGELWPVAELSEVAGTYGARVVLDAAQLVGHRPVDMTSLGVDWVAFSAHKMYAPFGVGALVGREDWLAAATPYLAGGGAAREVTVAEDGLQLRWSPVPGRHEAGSPNVIGVHALTAACETLSGTGWRSVTDHEEALLGPLRNGLAAIEGVRILSMWADHHPKTSIVAISVDGHNPGLIAAALSAEHGIGVRAGAFCAHPATRSLLAKAGENAGEHAIRVSVGLGNTLEHVHRLLAALTTLVLDGPRSSYRYVDGSWCPAPDPRPLPDFAFGDAEQGEHEPETETVSRPAGARAQRRIRV